MFSMHITEAVISITPSFFSTTSLIEIVSYFLASGLILGSLSYIPSIALARRIASASSSIALNTMPVSVEKYG